jgi:hypothetical protein
MVAAVGCGDSELGGVEQGKELGGHDERDSRDGRVTMNATGTRAISKRSYRLDKKPCCF